MLSISRSSVIIFAILAVGGCARDPLEEAAWQASRVGTAAGSGREGADTTGLDAGARITERFYFVAKYRASVEQRQVAEANARTVARRTTSSSQSRSRYLAVRTRSEKRAAAATSVMLWDTQSEEIVGNTVYQLNEQPPVGTVMRFETFAAEFVGVGG